MISLNAHNVLDYVIGAVLVLCPYFFGFADISVARNVFLVGGLGLIAYSLLTNYRYSIAKVIPVGVHMVLDLTLGLAVMLSPYIFGYRNLISGGQTVLHFLLGVGAWALVAATQPQVKRPQVEARAPEQEYPRKAA